MLFYIDLLNLVRQVELITSLSLMTRTQGKLQINSVYGHGTVEPGEKVGLIKLQATDCDVPFHLTIPGFGSETVKNRGVGLDNVTTFVQNRDRKRNTGVRSNKFLRINKICSGDISNLPPTVLDKLERKMNQNLQLALL